MEKEKVIIIAANINKNINDDIKIMLEKSKLK